MVSSFRRKVDGGVSPSPHRTRGQWAVGIVFQFRIVLHEITRLPRDWVKCCVAVRSDGITLNELSARCEKGRTDLRATAIEFKTCLSLDVFTGLIDEREIEIDLKGCHPIGLDLVRRKVATTAICMSRFTSKNARVHGRILPMEFEPGMKQGLEPLLQVEIFSRVVNEHLVAMELHRGRVDSLPLSRDPGPRSHTLRKSQSHDDPVCVDPSVQLPLPQRSEEQLHAKTVHAQKHEDVARQPSEMIWPQARRIPQSDLVTRRHRTGHGPLVLLSGDWVQKSRCSSSIYA